MTGTADAEPPALVQRLDVAWAVAAVHSVSGVELHVDGMFQGGEVGAARVRWPDGHPAVLTWSPGRGLADVRRGPLAAMAALHGRGWPVPRVELAIEHETAVVIVQELLPAGPRDG